VNVLARIISILFHPLLMATYLFSLLSLALPPALAPLQQSSHFKMIILIFLVTFVLPVLNMGIFKIFGSVKSFQMRERKERLMPFVFISLIYVLVTYLLYSPTKFSLNDNFMKLMLIIDTLVVIATLATFFFKVSVHSIGIWGMIGIMLLLTKIAEINTLFYVSLGLIIIAGFVMSSRLQLGAHNSREVMWGSVIGLATSVAGMLILF
jgi:hypothetical protein